MGHEAIPHLDPGMFVGDREVLTPVEIHHTIFTTVRFKVGYNPREVDDFMARAEAAVGALLRENGELRARLSGPGRSGEEPDADLSEAHRDLQRAIDLHRDRVQAILNAR
ncbi:DivIVA domain-containing protein [Herbidospora yilanensis]|uniref:DivIVA domain-containing protein n=1 Tax=Herbidospora yilanensis TaxID=354426 RepID=UPI000A9FF652|nr:DivIVA domain-containing protein [Herbidospora yilanensis]